jgi:hypothetical protein
MERRTEWLLSLDLLGKNRATIFVAIGEVHSNTGANVVLDSHGFCLVVGEVVKSTLFVDGNKCTTKRLCRHAKVLAAIHVCEPDLDEAELVAGILRRLEEMRSS